MSVKFKSKELENEHNKVERIMIEGEQIEEILFEAHAHNLRTEVMDLAKKLLESGEIKRKVDAYDKAYKTLIEKK